MSKSRRPEERDLDGVSPGESGAQTSPGKSQKAQADGAVNAALERAGSGSAHESGATFHDDPASHSAAAALGAKAFTAGSDVYFGAGQHSPGTATGDSLIEHELTHVKDAKDIEPPRPGNFRVSSPSDASEAAARSGSGVAVAPATIHRFDEGESETDGTGPAAGGSAGAAGAAVEASDPYEDWKAAVTGFKRDEVAAKWAKVPAGDKAKVASEDKSFKVRVVHVMEQDSVEVIKESGIPIDELAGQIFLNQAFADFLVPLRTHNLLNGFLDSGGQGWLVDDDKVAKLKTWVDATTSRTEAKRIFERPYPTLHDTAPGPVSFSGVVAPWPLPRIQRLYAVLAQYMDPGHVSTITGGFVYVTSPLFGWWSPSQKRVFLPASSNSSGHDMTGGRTAGHKADGSAGRSVSPDFTGADGKKKTGAAAEIGHFTGTILHEVGHGVGARLDGGRGNAYAENSASWPGFNVGMSLSSWANELWVSGARGSGSEPKVHGDAKLDDSHAKDFLKAEISGGEGAYDGGWGSDAPRDDIATYVKWRYASVPLQKWWNYFVEKKKKKGDAYRWDDESARLKGSWCYAYLSRGGSGYTKFKSQAWKQKVSWYSLSSPREWFAEQYTHYYRTEKTGSGMDGATLALMKDLDSKQFASDEGSDDGVTIADSSGGSSEDTGIAAAAGESSAEAAAGEGQAEADDTRPLFFPW
jgi:hypothetical protein